MMFQTKAGTLLCLVLVLPPLAAAPQAESSRSLLLIEASDLAVTGRDLATLCDIEGLSVSPDGQWMAFLIRQADPDANRYETAWYVIATTGESAPRRIAAAGEPMLGMQQGKVAGGIQVPPPVWSADSTWISYLRKDGGRVQVWRSHRDGGRTEQLTHSAGDISALVYSRDGRRILFEVEPDRAQIEAALAQEGRKGFLYDRRFSPSYRPTPTLPADASFMGDPKLRSRSQIAARRIGVYDLARRREREAAPAEQVEFAELIARPKPNKSPAFIFYSSAALADGSVAWTEARDPQRQGPYAPLTIVAQPAGAPAPIVCAAAECTSQGMRGIWWRNANEIVFARGAGSRLQDTLLYAWRLTDATPRLILSTPAKLASLEWSCTLAQDRLVCFYEDASTPRRLVAVDLETGHIKPLHDPNPDFARFNLPPPQRLEFRAPSGIESYGYLVLPPHRPAGRLPLVIVTYKCSGFLRGGSGDEYPVYPFAALGFAVLCYSVPDTDFERLTSEGWDAYQRWSRGPGDPEKRRVQEGLDAAVTQLDAAGIIDPDRIGLTGLSFGAETVTFALFNMPRLTAAIASGTEYGPASVFLHGPASFEQARAWSMDLPTSERWKTLSVTLNAGRVRSPLLLNVPDHELIGALHSYTSLALADRAVEMHVFPDEYHNKWQPAHRLAIYNRNIDWMNFWLRGVESGMTGDASQYERWRAMRQNQCRLFGPEGTEFSSRSKRREGLTDNDLIPWYCRPGGATAL